MRKRIEIVQRLREYQCKDALLLNKLKTAKKFEANTIHADRLLLFLKMREMKWMLDK
jgi:hypothetical protein